MKYDEEAFANLQRELTEVREFATQLWAKLALARGGLNPRKHKDLLERTQGGGSFYPRLPDWLDLEAAMELAEQILLKDK